MKVSEGSDRAVRGRGIKDNPWVSIGEGCRKAGEEWAGGSVES